ncbi:hypothetical protein IEU95_10075 [Hoyosella rhizosphaerae]|uniref:Uncharacterized protein n=1 Tax=Hoyosella rhizosphaerae TaxID=1755582 RepID=A0A916TZQ6_9ACTN|nr:hypothetical protein [Hoyosella rhizosphaerae]MBN4927181.1 hypothetical protein [Hoyosella rhizosphaerae]GGC53370.1 hypothetical protein GCM10011410_02150 [Hoyosella rhizosphaerae]
MGSIDYLNVVLDRTAGLPLLEQIETLSLGAGIYIFNAIAAVTPITPWAY